MLKKIGNAVKRWMDLGAEYDSFFLAVLNKKPEAQHGFAAYRAINKSRRVSTAKAKSPHTTTLAPKKSTVQPMVVTELEKMIGLQEVRQQISKIILSDIFDRARQGGGNVFLRKPLHMAFLGNPGTGKTEVARQVAHMLHEAGVLPTGNLVERKASDLIGEYIGHTAPKVDMACNQARGGVLFIDEAYMLEKTEKFGAEAAAQLLQHMENNRGEFIVILAGYPDDMKKLIKLNPGFESRIPYAINFPDYSQAELAQIMASMLADKNMKIDNDAALCASKYLDFIKKNAPTSFANARTVRNMIQRLCDIQAQRLSGVGDSFEDVLKIVKEFRRRGSMPLASADINTITKADVMHLFVQDRIPLPKGLEANTLGMA